MVIQMPPTKEIMLSRSFVNVKMLLTATFVCILFVCDLTLAQNPYGLKRPAFCSTCFTNDQSENYYCCYYFFRCCAESRLGSNNRKVTTPSPEYPDLHPVDEQQQTPISIPGDDTICKTCFPRNPNADGVRKPDAADVAAPSDGEDTHFSTDGYQKFAGVPETNEEVSPRYEDDSRGYSGRRTIPDSSYSPAFGGRRYPYNVPRVYPSQQPSRNTAWREPQNRNSNPGRWNTRYGETFEDSTGFRIRPSGRDSGRGNSGDVTWGRMEPVKDNFQRT